MSSRVPHLRFRVQAQLAQMSLLRERLDGFFEEFGSHFEARARMEVTLALDEAASNIVVHGYQRGEVEGVIDVEYEIVCEELVIRLWDDCGEQAPEEFVGLPPGVAGEGGMGTNIMRAIMSSVSYERRDNRNLLTMRRSKDHRSWTDSDDE